jgi:hypothetical protein
MSIRDKISPDFLTPATILMAFLGTLKRVQPTPKSARERFLLHGEAESPDTLDKLDVFSCVCQSRPRGLNAADCLAP